MHIKKLELRLLLTLLAVVLVTALAGCSGLSRLQDPESVGTVTPLPASVSDDGLSVQPTDACLIAQDAIIQVGIPQGNLLAWQPGEKVLAFVAPVGRSWGWSVGDIVLGSIGDGEPITTSDIHVAGDLTWSPDGSWLAFVALRTADNQYTVEVWRPADKTLIDLFAQGGMTDEFASRKGIVRWRGNNNLQISESCGVDCSRIIEVSVIGGEQQILEETRQAEDVSLNVIPYQPIGISYFPEWINPNVSPDMSSVFFSDEDDTGWIGIFMDDIKYPLDLQSGTALESKWSDDGRYLAVRTEQSVLVFQTDCSEAAEVKVLSEP